MTYLVMECHPGYGVVLDQNGHFLKVANLNYQVGQTVSSVIKLHTETEESSLEKPAKFHYFFRYATSAAACLLLAAIGSWNLILTPYGSVRMQINPDLRLNVNRLNYVISAEGLNLDGEAIMNGYQFKGRKVLQAADELAQRAMDMGYLKEGGEIRISVESTHTGWKTKTEEEILFELEHHTNHTITITPTAFDNEPGAPDVTEEAIKETAPPDTVAYSDDDDEQDDDNQDSDDGDDDNQDWDDDDQDSDDNANGQDENNDDSDSDDNDSDDDNNDSDDDNHSDDDNDSDDDDQDSDDDGNGQDENNDDSDSDDDEDEDD